MKHRGSATVPTEDEWTSQIPDALKSHRHTESPAEEPN